MSTPSIRCTDSTRIAGWLSTLVITATFAFLHDAYDRLPLLVPIQFEDGSPSLFAYKSAALVYLPFGLQVVLALVFIAILTVLMRRSSGPLDRGMAGAATQHAAEAIALLALIWITFQAVNAWRLDTLYRRTFDPQQELFVVALITAFTATVVVMARAVLQVQALDAADHAGSQLRAPVLDHQRRPLAVATLAVLLGTGLAVPLYVLALVWQGLRPI